ncbi:MAG: hypothetical protein LAP87_05225 [Acidobacteriia bacterium]|nr:hypothetical protein [Terriglobia bacterium]
MKRILWMIIAVIVLGAAVWGVGRSLTPGTVKFKTAYQAVLLTNGNVYYGKLEGLGGAFPILRDVFYVQAATDPNTKQTTSVLIRRGKEWHAPDYMAINAAHILMVEPVTPESRVAKLIADTR